MSSPDPVEPVDREEQIRVVQEPGYERRQVYTEDAAASQRHNLYQLSALIGFLFGILEGLIGIRILLRLMGANPANPFADFIYGFTSIFLAPFFGLVPSPRASGMVLEVSSIIAMIVYALLAWAIIRLVWLLFYRPTVRSVSNYERDSSRTYR